ncbi:hydroxypyruvate isomerase family protein [Caldilinea sp.]|uniref:hydroxypyruvate isomerase family protein n=1 Tax=Caldilinea sp. TaxID=2293560 RepID=UPI0021DEA65E|nr:TIM barrel protein [Caldilinea sp.]GIV67930.1 MAG: hydroxypyruvate isomerase [Caldilinea sp.]
MTPAYRQSISWWCFVPDPLSPEELLRAAVEIGYDAVELLPEAYWPLARQYGLAIASVNGHASIVEGLNRRAHHPRIVRELEANIAKAEQWRIANLICFSGSRDGLHDAAGVEATAEGLAQVARRAEDAGVTLVLEVLNSKVDHPDYQADHTAFAVEVCRQVNSPAVKVLYDIYHMQIMEGDIIRTIEAHHRWFGHYHTAGNPGRGELDEQQELNYAAIFRAIAATGYTGYIGHEFIPRKDPLAGLRAAFELACA